MQKIAGIDIGSHSIKVIIAQTQAHSSPIILGSAKQHTSGIKHGQIVNTGEVRRALKEAITKASSMANTQIDSAYLSVGGTALDSFKIEVDMPIAKAESKITRHDLELIMKKAINKHKKDLQNRKLLHSVPIRYFVDKQEVVGEPIGLSGNKLSMEALFITSIGPHYDKLVNIVESLDIEVLDSIAAPLAASLVVLDEDQKEAGCMLANIGAETVSVVVFEESVPISLKVFPIGSSDITNDIALKLQVPLSAAEELKLGSLRDESIPRKKIDDIIALKLKEIFTMLKKYLKEIGKDGLLPAGVILTGGGVGIAKIDDLARAVLKLPSELASLNVPNRLVKNSTWAVAYGLCIYGNSYQAERRKKRFSNNYLEKLVEFFKQFIP